LTGSTLASSLITFAGSLPAALAALAAASTLASSAFFLSSALSLRI